MSVDSVEGGSWSICCFTKAKVRSRFCIEIEPFYPCSDDRSSECNSRLKFHTTIIDNNNITACRLLLLPPVPSSRN